MPTDVLPEVMLGEFKLVTNIWSPVFLQLNNIHALLPPDPRGRSRFWYSSPAWDSRFSDFLISLEEYTTAPPNPRPFLGAGVDTDTSMSVYRRWRHASLGNIIQAAEAWQTDAAMKVHKATFACGTDHWCGLRMLGIYVREAKPFFMAE